MTTPGPRDPTPETGATAGEGHKRPIAWEAIERMPEFKALIRAKTRFILPATIFFIVYYFALPYLVGYQTEFMARKVWGNVNVAYLFALSQFFMAWVLAFIYVGVAAGWDRQAAALLKKFFETRS